ncbi:LysR family transcriptional regulator [Streptomyces halobius]|uniref:LysR family transcriptional regulator n=1 Tax=Streptomyces halobius TaxID=2879846 RepID=A0ABY4M2H9_9ACTN|nr:LysR family transcriptional regulator [Streptomyces halobius]UQA90550.1 LysR family transcriptional regulator [Streptomyces halobius]
MIREVQEITAIHKGEFSTVTAIDIDQLTHVIALHDADTFTRAAENLGLTQSALSRSIGRLKERLGYRIFVRGASRVELTTTGEALVGNLRALLPKLQNALVQEPTPLRLGYTVVMPDYWPYVRFELSRPIPASRWKSTNAFPPAEACSTVPPW